MKSHKVFLFILTSNTLLVHGMLRRQVTPEIEYLLYEDCSEKSSAEIRETLLGHLPEEFKNRLLMVGQEIISKGIAEG